MSARAISSGTISFGLVNIPVKVYAANESSARISFNQLHKKCRTRIKQQLFCPTDNETVSRDEIVKGYEFAKDQYVIFSEEELKAIEEESSKAIEIAEFVPLASVDPLYFESGYYVGPDKGSERAFKLLSVALEESQHAAVARFSSRGRQNLVLLRPLENGLVMQQLRYSDEIRALSEIPIGDADIKDAELQLAKQFISQLSNESFDATKYHDEHKKRLQEIIDRKVKGEEVTYTSPQTPEPRVVDLMEALKASLAKTQAKGAANEERKPPKRAPAREPAAKKAKAGKR
jgi:DNA end-binding protein Ku